MDRTRVFVCEIGKPVHVIGTTRLKLRRTVIHSLRSTKRFPEFQNNDLYLTGESYFGQYGPNIAKWILDQPDETVADVKIPLKELHSEMLVGRRCDERSV